MLWQPWSSTDREASLERSTTAEKSSEPLLRATRTQRHLFHKACGGALFKLCSCTPAVTSLLMSVCLSLWGKQPGTRNSQVLLGGCPFMGYEAGLGPARLQGHYMDGNNIKLNLESSRHHPTTIRYTFNTAK